MGIMTRPFFTILFLTCLIDSEQAITKTQENKYSGQNFNYNSLKLFNWNMGSDYCKSGETYPNCDSYIKESVDKLISIGGKYDILCLQELPKYDRSQQKATADKFINDFVLKYKYAIVRKEGTNIAILSKFPIRKQDDIQLSMHYGAQRIQFQAALKKYQVVNINIPHPSLVPNLQTRKEDISKVLKWMDSNAANFNILTGNFNVGYSDVENVIKDVKPFGLNGIPSRSCPGRIYCIFTWGEEGWPYSMEKMTEESFFQYGIIYSQIFYRSYQVVSHRAVSIVSQIGLSLDIFGNITSRAGNGSAAQFVYPSNQYDKFIMQVKLNFTYRGNTSNGYIIVSPFDKVNYLGIGTEQALSLVKNTAFMPLYWTRNHQSALVIRYYTFQGLNCPSLCYLSSQEGFGTIKNTIYFAGAQTYNQNGLKPRVFFKDL